MRLSGCWSVSSRHAFLRAVLVVALASGLALSSAPALGAGAAAPQRAAIDLRGAQVVARTDPGFVSFVASAGFFVGDLRAPAGSDPERPDPCCRAGWNWDRPPASFDRAKFLRLVRAFVGQRKAYLRLFPVGLSAWRPLMSVVRDLRLRVFLNVSVAPRLPSGAWRSEPTEQIFQEIAAHGDPVDAVEYGNEPNLFGVSDRLPGYSAATYAAELQNFAALLRRYLPKTKIVSSGPYLSPSDPNGERPFKPASLGPEARDFLSLLPRHFFDAVGFHYYPGWGEFRCPNFQPHIPKDRPLESAFLDEILRHEAYMRQLRDQYQPRAPLWITETGNASCGGDPDWSRSFAATFFWLNELGQMARRGVQVVFRQSMSDGDYALLNWATTDPTPDYWASLLWRRLMGERQLAVSLRAPRNVRVFASCTAGRRSGSVTFLVLNLDRRPLRLRLPIEGSRRVRVFVVTAPALSASQVFLNGKALSAPDGRVPPLPAKIANRSVRLPATSYAFVVQPIARAVCAPRASDR